MTRETVMPEVVRLTPGDYGEERAFLTRCREALPRKEFFYPYTDEQLKAVMDGGETFGIRDECGELIGTFNIDLDREYARELADGIFKSTGGAVRTRECFEASGLMVDARFRGRGLAKALMSAVVDRANELGIDLCGVVHIENVASLNTFFGNNFVVAGLYRMDERHIFLYLLKKFDFSFEIGGECGKINVKETDAVAAALAQGKIGTRLDGDSIVFSVLSRRA